MNLPRPMKSLPACQREYTGRVRFIIKLDER
jgi:hypothetical protein